MKTTQYVVHFYSHEDLALLSELCDIADLISELGDPNLPRILIAEAIS